MKVASIVCGSPNFWIPEALEGLVIGVDGGAKRLLEANVNFDVAMGDFDSVTPEELLAIKGRTEKVIEFEAEKDFTDAEAAINYAIELGYTRIKLYGALGGRFDHQTAVIYQLLRYAKKGIHIEVIDAQNLLFVATPGNHTFDVPHTYLSFFAMEEKVVGLTLSSVKYELDKYTLAVDDTLCSSNEQINGKANVSFDSGYLLVIMASD